MISDCSIFVNDPVAVLMILADFVPFERTLLENAKNFTKSMLAEYLEAGLHQLLMPCSHEVLSRNAMLSRQTSLPLLVLVCEGLISTELDRTCFI